MDDNNKKIFDFCNKVFSKQESRVYEYIENYGSITPLDAFRDLGITKLATVISNMKSKYDFKFHQHLDYDMNRFGEICHYMRYWLDFDKYTKDMEGIEL